MDKKTQIARRELMLKIYRGAKLESIDGRLMATWREGPRGGITKRKPMNLPFARDFLMYLCEGVGGIYVR